MPVLALQSPVGTGARYSEVMFASSHSPSRKPPGSASSNPFR